MKIWKTTLATLALALSTTVNATIIDFEAVTTSSSGGIYIGNPYSEDSFTLSTSDYGIYALQDGWQNDRGSSNGTNTAFMYGTGTQANFILARDDSSYFSLNSIDFAEVFNTGDSAAIFSAQSVNVFGTTSSGSTVTSVLLLDHISDGSGGADDFQTFTFNSDWASLSSVTFSALNTSSNTYINFDNIVLDNAALKNSTAQVPLPAPLWLLASGLILLTRFTKRKA